MYFVRCGVRVLIRLMCHTGRFLIRQLSGQKIDLNSGQWSTQPGSGGFFPFSTDLPFAQHDWPLGNATTRARVFAQHKWWTQAILCVCECVFIIEGIGRGRPWSIFCGAEMSGYAWCPADSILEMILTSAKSSHS